MTFIFVALQLALLIAQAAAYFQGMELWLGFGWLASLVVGVLAAGWLPFGSLAMSAVAFYGAWRGWDWEWWQAALLTWPFAIISLAAMFMSGAVGLVGLLRTRAAA